MKDSNKVSVPSGFDLLIERVQTGETYQSLGDKYQCSDVNIIKKIQRVLSKVNPDIQNMYLNKPNEAIKVIESLLVSEISNPAKIQKANLTQLAIAYGTIYDKRRLEEGKSTSNSSVSVVDDKIAELKSKLLASGIDPVSTLDITPDKVDK